MRGRCGRGVDDDTGRGVDRELNERLRGGLAIAIRLATVAAPIAFGVFLVGSVFGGGDDEPAEAGFARLRAERPTREARLDAGESLEAFLARGGLGAREARRLLELTRPFLNGRPPAPGTLARYHGWPGEAPVQVDLTVDADRTLVFRLDGAVWDARVDSVLTYRDTVVVAGEVETSLWAARLAGDEALTTDQKADLPGHLEDVFAWQVDFWNDPAPGDRFRLALEREVRPDGSVRESRVLGAEYVLGGERLEAIEFAPSDEPGSFFYDAEGNSLRGPFLRAPLDLVRVSSRYSGSRPHPILGLARAHRGIDYAAASGTPVRVTGAGTIRSAGWSGDFGLMIEVDHSGGIRTRYAHLSGVAEGIAPGRAVAQGDHIGAVGATGLASGAHLHYEFLLHGRAVDPASVDLPVERPLADADRERFEAARLASRSLLGRVALAAAPGPDTVDRAP